MSEELWIWQCDRWLPSCVGAGREIGETIAEELTRQHWDSRDIFGVRLATEEALVNAIKHGNRSDPDKRVHVVCRVSPRVIRIEITDEGAGFNPEALPDPTDSGHLELPGGRGVMLMKCFMSRVDFGASGNHITLEKERS